MFFIDVLFMLSLPLFALVVVLLWKMIGLSSHGRFITENTSALDDNTVNWNIHTIDNLDDVTYMNVIFMDFYFLLVSNNPNL